MKKLYIIIIVIVFPFTLIAQTITLEAFGPNFDNPTNMQHAGDDLFIVDQEGYIRILHPNGSTPATPFLNIESRVNDQGVSWEAGLLGLAFHPNYTSNGYFYVYYINQNNTKCIVSRFKRNNSNPDLADSNSELIILEIPMVIGFTHFGGDLHFDGGNLYISVGDDGTTGGDTQNLAQNLNSLRGKILRIDVDNPTGGKNYGIPASNPFVESPVDDPNTLGEIWAYGLRNPAKFSFDSANGDMWIADVGHDFYEEVNLNSGNSSALNYGWPCYEANATFNNDTPVNCPNVGSLTFPVNDYPHNESGEPFKCAVIGGYLYRGTMQSNLTGKYFFADWCSDNIFILTKNGSSWSRENYEPSISTQNWTSFAEGNNQELYIIGNSGGSGKVYKIKQEGGLSTNSIDAKTSFSIVPNPTSNRIVSLTFLNGIELQEINTYNLHGQKVKSSILSINTNTVNLELNGLASGIYIIEAISTSGEKSQNKLVIE